MTADTSLSARPKVPAWEVFIAFLRLGLTSFGGPVAHLGYFRTEFVERRRWLDDGAFADLVALCQFLPGPASSQVGFAIGLSRGGGLGALAAWTAFTLPSALLMLGFAYGASALDNPIGLGIIHGLKLAAVAVVAQAVLGMARTLAPDAVRAGLAIGALFVVTIFGSAYGQLLAIVVGALAGLFVCRSAAPAAITKLRFGVPRGVAIAAAAVFALLLFGVPVLAAATGSQLLAAFNAFYRSGALVFGGGHVVLPLLQTGVVQPGWVAPDQFLSGYAAAQALPGPLFTFATYIGALVRPGPNGFAGAALATVAVFLPGMLLLVASLPFWNRFRTQPAAQAGLRGANAAVVGVLAAALYNPVWSSSVLVPIDFAVAGAGFVALISWRTPPVAVVVGCALAAVAATFA